MTLAKAWAQAFFTVISVVVPLLAAGPLTPTEWTNSALLFLGTVLVAVVPNLTQTTAKYAKGIISGAMTVGTLLVSFFADGSYAITAPEWMQIAAALLALVGVVGLPAPQWAGTVVTTRQLRSTP
jgi:hypothetical protein